MMQSLNSKPSFTSTSIAIACSALLALGMVMVFSASASLTSPPITHDILKNPSIRQALFSLIGLITLLMVGLCPYESWSIRKGRWWQPSIAFLLAVIALLAVVLVPGIGEERNGARRWLSLGPSSIGLGFQPSELAKVAVVIFVAGVCSHMGQRIRKFWTGLLPMLLLIAAVGALVGKEDLGTAALLVFVGGCILFASGARFWHLALLSLPLIVGLVYLIKAEPYRIERLLAFQHPDLDAQGRNYQPMQSLITIATGGWLGQGLGAGVQKYGYLPEGRSDFIFAVICEELGIVSGLGVIGLFGILIWQGRRAMLAASDEFGRLLALGITLTLGFQAAMNIAVVTVSVPTKGIGLPLVSAGGSGVIIFSFLMGVLVNVARCRVPGVEGSGARAEEWSPQPGLVTAPQ
jgi:cell division protein FtsW